MKIDKVSIRYGELRSTGYPSFNNKRVEVEYSAIVEDGESVHAIEQYLLERAKSDVAHEFGNSKDNNFQLKAY